MIGTLRAAALGLGVTLMAAPLVLSACTAIGGQTHSGVFRQGFEQADFYPDAGGGPWWVTWESEAVGERLGQFWTGDGRGRHSIVRMTVAGELSDEGRHGHLGAYARELRIMEIKEIAPATEEEFLAAADKAVN